jgi:hypothetical protein
MKKLSDFCGKEIAPVTHEVSRHEEKIWITLNKQAGDEVNKVFSQLQTVFPAWRQAFPDQKMLNAGKLQWSKALIEAGICTKEQIAVGFKKARTSDIPFFPSPGTFIKWCQPSPEAFGIPSADSAYNLIIMRKITESTHDLVKIISKRTRWERQTLSSDEYRKIFDREYQILFRVIAGGGDISSEIPKGIENKTKPKLKFTPTGWVVDHGEIE